MSLNDFLVTETVNGIFGRVESTMEEVSNTYRKIEEREKEVVFNIIEASITNESDKKAVSNYIKGLEKKLEFTQGLADYRMTLIKQKENERDTVIDLMKQRKGAK